MLDANREVVARYSDSAGTRGSKEKKVVRVLTNSVTNTLAGAVSYYNYSEVNGKTKPAPGNRSLCGRSGREQEPSPEGGG
jgi:hypothetical protein